MLKAFRILDLEPRCGSFGILRLESRCGCGSFGILGLQSRSGLGLGVTRKAWNPEELRLNSALADFIHIWILGLESRCGCGSFGILGLQSRSGLGLGVTRKAWNPEELRLNSALADFIRIWILRLESRCGCGSFGILGLQSRSGLGLGVTRKAWNPEELRLNSALADFIHIWILGLESRRP